MSKLGKHTDEKPAVRRAAPIGVRPVPTLRSPSSGPVFGRLAGHIHIAADFDHTPSEVIDAMEGNS